jgi:hypothetical protein
LAARGLRWPWLALGAAVAVGVGVVAALFLLDGDGGGDGDEPGVGRPQTATVGMEESVRFQLLSGRCGYEVVVTSRATVPPENGQFCLVRLDVRNLGDIPRSFDPSCQYLIDTAGGRHEQRHDVLPLDEATAEFFEQELAPKTLARDIGLYYDVPLGIEAGAAEVHTSCESPGVLLDAVA